MNVCLLGASGSIGSQTIDVMKKNRQDFNLVAFSVGQRTYKIKQIIKVFPDVKYICVGNSTSIRNLQKQSR